MSAFYLRGVTPKEFVAALRHLISLKTAQKWCRIGKLETVNGPGKPPYIIKADELLKYRTDVSGLVIKDDSPDPRQ